MPRWWTSSCLDVDTTSKLSIDHPVFVLLDTSTSRQYQAMYQIVLVDSRRAVMSKLWAFFMMSRLAPTVGFVEFLFWSVFWMKNYFILGRKDRTWMFPILLEWTSISFILYIFTSRHIFICSLCDKLTYFRGIWKKTAFELDLTMIKNQNHRQVKFKCNLRLNKCLLIFCTIPHIQLWHRYWT